MPIALYQCLYQRGFGTQGQAMTLAKVSGTKIRGGVYHLNIAIPPEIRHLHLGRALLTGTLKTADPKVAAKGVTLARAQLIQQVEETARSADLNARLAELTPDQRALYDRAGGLEGLLEVFQRTRKALAFFAASDPSTMADTDEIPPDPLELEMAAAEHRAASAALEVSARREAKTLRALGQKVDIPGGDLTGLAELADSFIRAKSYTIQNADSLRYTVRRWTEFHGDQPLANLTRAHLAEFDDAARDLPVAREWLKKPMRAAVAAAKKGNLDRVSYKVRERLITHLKALSAFALDKGALAVDPWAGYRIDKPKEKVSDSKAQKVAGFTPAEVKAILAHVAATAHADTADHWLPMLSAYSGARREELGQLRVEDVLTGGNIPALRITDEGEDQKVKNAHSLRTIPIPPVCIERGFLDFVARRRQAGGTMLFLEEYTDKRHQKTLREMTPDPRGRLTEVYGGRFSRKVLAPLGIKTKGQGFHALRHSWTDAARRAKIDPEIRRLIAGRLEGEDATEAGYGGGDLLAEKLEALIKVAGYVEE
jgi:integrase